MKHNIITALEILRKKDRNNSLERLAQHCLSENNNQRHSTKSLSNFLELITMKISSGRSLVGLIMDSAMFPMPSSNQD
ncbi:MAG: hypothetical protein DRI23_11695 [Candidatus Cloacimonadota bacterium]|nr:MAG: hypothetical protein DRI23_11695 [Candidatus Cloacimonadota bacterium]